MNYSYHIVSRSELSYLSSFPGPLQFDYVLIDRQPSRSQLCLTAVGASDHIVMPVEANVKGVNSLMDTLDFLHEQANLMASNGRVIGIVPFCDRWVGNTQTLEGRQNIEAMGELACDVPILPSVWESEKFGQS